MKILLMGNPNVGKSAIFSRLTGADVVISNYPGSTVEFKKGSMQLNNESVELIDVPGTYSLDPTNKAERVAVKMLEKGDLVINVIDSTNLERNLNLTLQLFEKKIPMVIALNLFDETKHTGIDIDVKKLEELLKIPTVATVGVTGEGIKKLVKRLKKPRTSKIKKQSNKERWGQIGKIVEDVQDVKHKHHTFSEVLSDLSIKPITGVPIAIIFALLLFTVIRLIGESLIVYVLDPIFNVYSILIMKLSTLLGSGFLHEIFIGTLFNGEIDYIQSMGLLTTGLYVPIAMILPYIFAFYLVLGILEDTGYLPRLAVLIDNVMHKIGLHGFAIIPMLLGLGCNVPGALSTRILESKREKFIAATLMAICVPCMAQMAMVFGLMGGYGIKGMGTLIFTLFITWLILGLILNRSVKGMSQEIFMEIPPYRIPNFKSLYKKLWMRTRYFIKGAIPYVLLGVFIVNILYFLGIIDFIGRLASPIVVSVLGLPEGAIAALVIGFLRKDVAVGMLLPLGLTLKQLIIASVVLTMYFPCVATFAVLIKELGVKDMIKSTIIMVIVTLTVGFALNMLLPF